MSLKEKWLTALRSGEYEQGQGQLRQRSYTPGYEYKHCCLGVLAEVITKEGLSKADWVGGSFGIGKDRSRGSTDCVLSLSSDEPGIETKLIQMNDREHSAFKEIADYIETHVTKVVLYYPHRHGEE